MKLKENCKTVSFLDGKESKVIFYTPIGNEVVQSKCVRKKVKMRMCTEMPITSIVYSILYVKHYVSFISPELLSYAIPKDINTTLWRKHQISPTL